MADAIVKVQEGRAVVVPFGADLLKSSLAAVSEAADRAEEAAAEATAAVAGVPAALEGKADKVFFDNEVVSRLADRALEQHATFKVPGGVNRPFIAIRDYRTPQDFGAAGNDVNSDVQGLYDAIASGQEVRLPRDDSDTPLLLNGETFTPMDGQRFVGGGRLKKTTQTNVEPLFSMNGTKNVTFDGVRLAGAAGAREYLVYMLNVENVTFDRMEFNGLGESGPQGGGNNTIHVGSGSRNVCVRRSTLRYGLGVSIGGDPLNGLGNEPLAAFVDGLWIEGCVIDSTDTEALDVNWHVRNLWFRRNLLLNIGRRGDAANEAIDIGGTVDAADTMLCESIFVTDNVIKLANTSANTDPLYRNAQRGAQIKQFSKNVRVLRNDFYGSGQSGADALIFSNARENCEFSQNVAYDFDRLLYAVSGTNRTIATRNKGYRIKVSGIATNNDATQVYNNDDWRGNEVYGYDADGNPAATGSGADLRDCRNLDVSGFRAEGFTGATSGLGRGLSIGVDCSDVKADNAVIKACRQGAVVAAPRCSMRDADVSFCVAEALYATAAPDLIVTDPRFYNNSTGGSAYQVKIDGGCDRLSVKGGTISDDRTPKLARGIQAIGTNVDSEIDVQIPTFLTSAVSIASGSITRVNISANNVSKTETVTSDTNLTRTPFASPWDVLDTATLNTADRTVTFSATNAVEGQEFTWTRTGTGTFSRVVNGKALGTNTWARVKYLAGAWRVVAYGPL